MDKERDTKAVKQIIDKVYGEEPTAVLISRLPAKYRVVCNEEVAKAIIEAGYGDTKQAVREFAEKLETKAQTLQGDGFDEYNEGFDRGVKETLYLINELLAEVIGE